MWPGWGGWPEKNISLVMSMPSLQGISETHPCLNKFGGNDSTTSTKDVHRGKTSESDQEDRGINRLEFDCVRWFGKDSENWVSLFLDAPKRRSGWEWSIVYLNKSYPEGFVGWGSSDTRQPGLQRGCLVTSTASLSCLWADVSPKWVGFYLHPSRPWGLVWLCLWTGL